MLATLAEPTFSQFPIPQVPGNFCPTCKASICFTPIATGLRVTCGCNKFLEVEGIDNVWDIIRIFEYVDPIPV